MKTILITGGSGLIGTRLTSLLQGKGYRVRHLSRTKKNSSIETFIWDLKKKYIQEGAFEGVDFLIHLAGEGIADKPWTVERKRLVIASRKETAELLFEKWKESGAALEAFITASAIGYYGLETQEHIFEETDPPAATFIAQTCFLWEQAADPFIKKGIRTVAIRIGLVLSKNGGALGKMGPIVKTGLAAPLGTGKQWMPWIHMDDVCGQFIAGIEDDQWNGVYNGVAPNPVTHKAFIKALGKTLRRPVFLPRVPEFVLKLIMGEMAQIVLEGCRVSEKKTLETGFSFQFTNLESALAEIYKNET